MPYQWHWPYCSGLLMMCCMQTEWTPGNARQSAGKSISSPGGTTPSAAEARESMKEKVCIVHVYTWWHGSCLATNRSFAKA